MKSQTSEYLKTIRCEIQIASLQIEKALSQRSYAIIAPAMILIWMVSSSLKEMENSRRTIASTEVAMLIDLLSVNVDLLKYGSIPDPQKVALENAVRDLRSLAKDIS